MRHLHDDVAPVDLDPDEVVSEFVDEQTGEVIAVWTLGSFLDDAAELDELAADLEAKGEHEAALAARLEAGMIRKAARTRDYDLLRWFAKRNLLPVKRVDHNGPTGERAWDEFSVSRQDRPLAAARRVVPRFRGPRRARLRSRRVRRARRARSPGRQSDDDEPAERVAAWLQPRGTNVRKPARRAEARA